MKGNPKSGPLALGAVRGRTGATVRSAAQKFGISKSTVHKDHTARPERQKTGLIQRSARAAHKQRERHLQAAESPRGTNIT